MTNALELRGRQADKPRLPDLFASVSRSTDAARSEFLPDGYLTPRKTWDVGPLARSGDATATTQRHSGGDDEVLVLELADGSTLVTSAARLRVSLQATHPELVAEDGTVLLEELRATGAAAQRGLGDAVGGLISKVFSFGVGGKVDEILAEAAREFKLDVALLGVSWLGTKALMWAVEKRLPRGPGLYAWSGGEQLAATPLAQLDARVQAAPDKHPMLVFLHGTASHTLGSFGDLRGAGREWWGALERRFPGGIYGFEHRTLSESPIDNALALLEALPTGAHLSLVSHSRGGLVGDLLCLDDIGSLIDRYRHGFEGTGDVDPVEAARVIAQLADAHAEQRDKLQRLARLLASRRPVVQRYVRVASPAAGTRLASGNFDVFLSGLLTLIGRVPVFFGSPYYAAFKRVVVEIARNRTNARLVPGIEAMLPDAPMAALLRDAPVRAGLQMSVIAGDIEGGGLFQRFGVMLTDHLLFDAVDNDLVVDTPAMLAGIAARAVARVKFDRGDDVSHFKYFENTDTREALNDWLLAEDTATVASFRALPAPGEYEAALKAAAVSRDTGLPDRPVVFVLPGVMGSHLGVRPGAGPKEDRVWFDPLDIAAGGLAKIAWGRPGVLPQELFGMFYGKLCQHLATGHRVERFAYDWRLPLDQLADQLAAQLQLQLDRSEQPVRLLAHSMGGLVVRACIHRHRALMDRLMARNGARLVMLGTPNQGAYSMVENLLGKGDTLRTLVRLDVKHDMQEVLDIVAGFRGALQLLPKPGFKDIFQGQSDGGEDGWEFQRAKTWAEQLPPKNRDLWFGNGKVGKPAQDVLDAASWLWQQDGPARPALPSDYEAKSIYVFGLASNTPCGLRVVDGRLKMVGTTRGDGTVSWESGRIGGIGSFYYMPAEHGDLPATEEYFPALAELLADGRTERLALRPPTVRAVEQAVPVSYDAGPPGTDDADTAQRRLLGGSLRRRAGAPAQPRRRLEVVVRGMDLRFLQQPILVGHYEHDPIAGPQALIDRELLLDNELSERHRLGLYPGPLGTAGAVLYRPNVLEQARGSLTGVVVTGLGTYDKPLSLANLTEAVRTGALRYLLHAVDVLGREPRELPLAALLIGYNSSANLTVGASVEALVRGVLEANLAFRETTRLDLRIHRLDLVELYLDTAISAAYALRQLEARMAPEAQRLGMQLVCRGELFEGPGVRLRLYDGGGGGAYWPRLMITDAGRPEGDEMPAPAPAPAPAPPANPALAAVPPTRAQLPDRLRFLYVGQRARAESVVQQRQPGLVEQLVRGQIANPIWDEDFGRMLFQLMVPYDFKDAARQMERVVLVVDSYTANLPWELMLADDTTRKDADRRPLALRTAVVRQLASSSFRRQVRQSISQTALVVGNPSVAGFELAFPGTPERPTQPPPDLQGAETEATAVAVQLEGRGYGVASVIGADKTAKDVLAALYRQPWRFLHISAHGVFDLPHVDGRKRSGVLLSDGLLISAAEIEAMEVVPELVFLNCCHLGKVDSAHVRDGNKLAASVARELIEIGVRCVVVAGWAVDDTSAQVFGQAFYRELLQAGKAFGDAVFAARKEVWDTNPGEITWGAFQAYGDPGWMAARQTADRRRPGAGDGYVSPEELLDDLARLRADLARRSGKHAAGDRRKGIEAVETMLRERCPPGWLARAEVQSALGAAWYDLGDFERAGKSLQAAVAAEDERGRLPIRDIEKLANVEARLGERTDSAATISRAIDRLETLDRLMSPGFGATGSPAPSRSVERSSLLGSAHKRLAGLYARVLLGAQPDADEAERVGTALRQALEHSRDAYRAAAGGSETQAYPLLNRLALEALTPWLGTPEEHQAAVALARESGRIAAASFAASGSPWDAVMQPEAVLVEHLLDGSLGAAGDAGDKALERVGQAYAHALTSVVIKPVQVDSVASQMELLSRFFDALSLASAEPEAGAMRRSADRLLLLLQRVQPTRARRKDRPGAAAATPAATTTKRPARKTAEKAAKKAAKAATKAPVRKAAAKAPKAPARKGR